MARQGISRSMSLAMGVTSKRPTPSPAPPKMSFGIESAWRTPKPSTVSRLRSVQRSTKRRTPSVGSWRCAAR
jgi:hypothetical protein